MNENYVHPFDDRLAVLRCRVCGKDHSEETGDLYCPGYPINMSPHECLYCTGVNTDIVQEFLANSETPE